MRRWRGLPCTRHCLRRAALPGETSFTRMVGSPAVPNLSVTPASARRAHGTVCAAPPCPAKRASLGAPAIPARKDTETKRLLPERSGRSCFAHIFVHTFGRIFRKPLAFDSGKRYNKLLLRMAPVPIFTSNAFGSVQPVNCREKPAGTGFWHDVSRADSPMVKPAPRKSRF